VALECAHERWGYERAAAEDPTIFGGRIAVQPTPNNIGMTGTTYHERHDHPNVAIAEELLALFPEARDEFLALVDTFSPLNDRERDMLPVGLAEPRIRGAVCGGVRFGWVYATVYDPVGLAESWLHEMAHWKLRAFGVDYEAAARLIVNDPEERFISPVRTDTTRPMPAVVQAQYAWTYLTDLDVRLAARDLAEARYYLSLNVPRLEAGATEIERHARTDEAGAAFLDALLTWCRRVIREGREILR
jgi:hypothetical protein